MSSYLRSGLRSTSEYRVLCNTTVRRTVWRSLPALDRDSQQQGPERCGNVPGTLQLYLGRRAADLFRPSKESRPDLGLMSMGAALTQSLWAARRSPFLRLETSCPGVSRCGRRSIGLGQARLRLRLCRRGGGGRVREEHSEGDVGKNPVSRGGLISSERTGTPNSAPAFWIALSPIRSGWWLILVKVDDWQLKALRGEKWFPTLPLCESRSRPRRRGGTGRKL